MTRRHDPRRARVHRSYTAAEVASLFNVTIHTVRGWKKEGLLPLEGTYPHLFAGTVVADFVRAKNKPRQPTGPGELFCVACKAVTRPLNGEVTVIPMSASASDLRGRCPRCERFIFQRVRISEIERKKGDLILRYEDERVPMQENCELPHTSSPTGEGS